MITNKDISIDSENGKITLNGNKYDLGTQGEIDTAVKDVYSVMGQNGAKNLNIFPYKNGGAGDTWESSGITFTVNADGTIDANGTATADAYFRCGTSTDDSNPIYLEEGKKYILSGTGATGVGVILRDSNNLVATAGETDVVYNCTSSGKYYILVVVRKQKTVDHFIIKPMLRYASDTDNTYEPYAMTNKQLTDQLGTKQDTLTFDSAPTDASTNPVTSGGVYSAVAALSGNFTQTQYNDFDDLPHGSIVQIPGSAAHAPGLAAHYYIVFTYFIAGTTTFKSQFAIENTDGNLYTRDCANGTWGNWNKFAKATS